MPEAHGQRLLAQPWYAASGDKNLWAPRLRTLLLTACLLGSSAGSWAQAPSPAFSWPGGARAAVSLSYDDALASLERAVRVGIGSRMFDPQTLVLLDRKSVV